MEEIHKKSLCNNWGSSIFFIANLLNFVLATAVFTIPFPMHEVGIILGTIILTITCFISVIACTFIIEALALKNSMLKQENAILNKAIQENGEEPRESIDKEEKDKDKDRPTFLSKKSLASNIDELQKDNNKIFIDEKEEKEEKEELIIDDSSEDILERSNSLYIYKRFEISKLSKALPKIGYYFVVLTIICYLYVGVTSNGIIAGNNLKDIIGKSFDIDMPDYSYYIIVICFFIITIIIALNNIKHLKKFSMFIMIMRFLIIFLIMGCCFYSMAEYGIADIKDVPKFDLLLVIFFLYYLLYYIVILVYLLLVIQNIAVIKAMISL